MALSEGQIVRYSRQILLKEVGGKGQVRLLALGFLATGEGAAQETALAYLAAGGTQVAVPTLLGGRTSRPGEAGFLITQAEADEGALFGVVLQRAASELNPDSVRPEAPLGRLAEVPGAFDGDGPWVALGMKGALSWVIFRSARGCRSCFENAVAALSGPVPPTLATLTGTAAALTAQRLALGIGEEIGAVTLSEDGTMERPLLEPCGRCRG